MAAGHLPEGWTPSSKIVETTRDLSEDFPGGTDARRSGMFERPGDGLLDREPGASHERRGGGFEPQPRAPAVSRIALAIKEASFNQPLQNAGHRTRMQPHNVGEIPR